jgi:hypothetical protein
MSRVTACVFVQKTYQNFQRQGAVRIMIDYRTARGGTVGRRTALQAGKQPF